FHRFTAENLAAVLQSEQERGRYVAQHAADLGYAVDQAAWLQSSSWMMLVRFSLSLTDQSIEAPNLLDHLASPFRKENRSLLSRLKTFCSILVIRFAPKALSLELSRRNLGYLKL
ncbi:MAG: hypothetical protein L0287_26050, partial [Anaerolineae bacterium]|nr:hypothetical protein [Anaerolineae bacterium]